MSLGISVYFGLDNTMEENIKLLSEAKKLGFTRIFTSLHIPEANYEILKKELDIDNQAFIEKFELDYNKNEIKMLSYTVKDINNNKYYYISNNTKSYNVYISKIYDYNEEDMLVFNPMEYNIDIEKFLDIINNVKFKENKDADSKADDTDKDAKDSKTSEGKTLADLNLEDGDYTMDVTLTGGSGRATIDSPAAINVEGDKATATIVWSSPNYDYMLVDGEKYEPVNKDGNSTFEIPVSVFDAEMEVTADTVAMSEPHEIDYTLNFDSTTAKEAEKTAK